MALDVAPGERRVMLKFDSGKQLVCELFGPRGNWFLLDQEGRILCSAFRPGGRRAVLCPGTLYKAPSVPALPETALPETALPSLPEDPEAWLEEQQRHAEALEKKRELQKLEQVLRTALEREKRGLAKRLEGLKKRTAAEEGEQLLQREAELLLTQPNQNQRGAKEIEVQDWYDEGKPRRILLDPKHDLKTNAEKKFARARTLREGKERTKVESEQTKKKLNEVLLTLEKLDASLGEENTSQTISERLTTLQQLKEKAGRLLDGRPSQYKKNKASPRLPYRLFQSRDGLDILVGRGRRDNDKLSKGIARGRDLWLHIGGGFAGSHVVLRLQKDQAPPTESLLDAATLAVHFSKARGKSPAEVLYTKASQVRKRKGAPPGLVEVIRHKTLLLRFEEERLKRLLSTLGPEDKKQKGKR
jgi:predicted ribosome quality control (RQC) complex YloA/Tae2 family protein